MISRATWKKNDKLNILSMDFWSIMQLKNFILKKPESLSNEFPFIFEKEREKINIGATNISSRPRVQAHDKSRAIQKLRRESSLLKPLNSSWTKICRENCHLGIPIYSHSFPKKIQWIDWSKTQPDKVKTRARNGTEVTSDEMMMIEKHRLQINVK